MTVRVCSILKTLAMAAALLVIGNGCGGFNATPAFSPLMFFLPGLADNNNDENAAARQPSSKPTQVASNGELAQAN